MTEKCTPPGKLKAEYETYAVNWEGIDLVIRHCRSWLSANVDFQTQHIEVQSAGSVPLPITSTGYRSIFLNGSEALAEYQGNPVNYVLSYLRHEAEGKDWQWKMEQDRQPDLFG